MKPPKGHPERSDRLSFLLEHLEQTGFTQDYPLLEAPPIDENLIALAHHPELVNRLRAICSEAGAHPSGSGYLDGPRKPVWRLTGCRICLAGG